jgi:hypothetical protein
MDKPVVQGGVSAIESGKGMFLLQRDRSRKIQGFSQGDALENKFRSPELFRAGRSNKSSKARDWLPETVKSRWSSNAFSAARQALSRMKSVSDL